MPDNMKLNPLEFAKTVGVHDVNASRFKIRIPKWMVNIHKEKQKVSFNNNIFINDNSCKVAPSQYVSVQNYITVQRTPNCDLSHVAIRDETGNIIIPDNTTIICACFYDKYIYLTDAYQQRSDTND